MKRHAGLALALAALMIGGGVAIALPATTPDATLGTDGPVRALVQVGNIMWVGGRFTETSDGQGGLSNIVALDVATGQRAAVAAEPQLTGSGSIVYDLSTDGTTVYAAGKFTAANGAKNLVAFDGTTGMLTQKFTAPNLKSVLFDNGRILGGSAKLQAWLPTGKLDRTWTISKVQIDASIRQHATSPAYRDMKPAPGGGYFAACQCDSLIQSGITYQTKAVVRLDADGTYDDTWLPGGTNPLRDDSAAFGIDLYIDGEVVVLAAGGSDFTATYDALTGEQIWKVDTNGSSQTVIRYTDAQGPNYLVGGHYRCLSGTSTGGNETDVFHPRLSALDLNGDLDASWTVPITPKFNGVWVLQQDTLGRLWIGGEFKKVGGEWSGNSSNTCGSTNPTAVNQTPQPFLARLSSS
jgi:outer membrane protein assembly factor BamB